LTLPQLKMPDLPHLKEQALSWQKIVAQYSTPNLGRSIWQVVNSFGSFILLWALMYKAMSVSYWLTLLLAPIAAGMSMRIFIILHDCGHNSFFKSSKANDIVGTLAGVFTFTPYLQWRHDHALHHAGSGDLERRGIGDVYTMTVDEYLKASRWQRIKYRVYRNPVVLFGLAPVLLFLVSHRQASSQNGPREQVNLHLTNAALLALFVALGAALGFKEVIMVQLPILCIAASLGVWLFYVQHQFEDTYWEHHPDWRYMPAALIGSSYFKLPRLLQWFSGNIGFHHIHHLSPRIPNYNLERAFKDNPLFQHVTTIHIWESLRTVSLKLWDEQQKKLVGFGHLKTLRMQ
jgi:omega-6 fatty acid desaturase (delta-12 desaturase)